jgi:hypothetical protein
MIPNSIGKRSDFTGGHSLAIISMVGYRVRQPARLVIQAIVLRDQPHSNGASDATVHNRHLEGREQDTVRRDEKWNELLGVGRGRAGRRASDQTEFQLREKRHER